MRLTLITTAILGATTLTATAATLSGSTGYGLRNNGMELTIFEDLGMASQGTNVTLSDRLNAIAYRPVTRELYGYQVGTGGAADQVFIIDPMTGMLTNTGATSPEGAKLSQGSRVGFDFNNAIDAARAVSTSDENVVFFPSSFGDDRANSILQFTDLAYAEGDENFGSNPRIFANAYTNAIDGTTASETLQFALDANSNSLVTLANNAGTLNTIAPITLSGQMFDFNQNGGFEILSDSEGDNLAIALLTERDTDNTGLYTIDLATGAASFFGEDLRGQYRGFAAMTNSTVAAVPLPAGIPLILTGLGAFGAIRAARRKKA
ncbi:DUF4394 domain-containing protein [Palleronia sp. LCG004]|uniref:DUF4394 domain-containing protein n=1 Tax=Palleronia sp. LCG004 TaxID=3079304 RepID=UPI0029435A82|nr:DUF4394 domain-containing protein [Palleronia sp. LCG004]WOI58030.1 DUF4394 domain-containing protein [Palleronia sp. LCG004]